MKNIIEKRYSPRAFSEKNVEKEKIDLIFESARIAPSAYNSQPWRFVLLDKKNELYKKVFDSLIEFNQLWAKNAPYLILTLAKNTFDHNGGEYKHSWYDLGQSVAYLTLHASELGLYLHQMSGFNATKLIEDTLISEDFFPVTVIALGYLGELNNLPEEIKKMENLPRKRKPINEILLDKLPIK